MLKRLAEETRISFYEISKSKLNLEFDVETYVLNKLILCTKYEGGYDKTTLSTLKFYEQIIYFLKFILGNRLPYLLIIA